MVNERGVKDAGLSTWPFLGKAEGEIWGGALGEAGNQTSKAGETVSDRRTAKVAGNVILPFCRLDVIPVLCGPEYPQIKLHTERY